MHGRVDASVTLKMPIVCCTGTLVTRLFLDAGKPEAEKKDCRQQKQSGKSKIGNIQVDQTDQSDPGTDSTVDLERRMD